MFTGICDGIFIVATRLPVRSQRTYVERALSSRHDIAVGPAPGIVRQLLDIAPAPVTLRLGERGRRADQRLQPVRRGGIGQEIGRAHAELQSLMRISYAVFCLKKKKNNISNDTLQSIAHINVRNMTTVKHT